MIDDDSIIIDTSINKSKKRSILSVICKVQLDYIAERTYKCPNCHNQYFVGIEILENEDVFESAHQDENIELEGIQGINKPLIEMADDISEDKEKKSGFYSMDYIKGPGKTIVEYEEEIPSEEE